MTNRYRWFAVLLTALITSTSFASAQPAPLTGFDNYVARAVGDWDVPGLAVAVVKDGRVAVQADEGGAYVVPSKPPLADAYEKGLLKTQNILKLDFATYRQLVARWCGEGAPYLASRGSA